MSFWRISKPIFAAVGANPIDQLGVPTAPQNLMGMRATDLLLIILFLVLLATALILWALFVRKPKTDTGRVRVHKSRPPEIEERDDGTIRKRKKHKRQRRAHRTRNPTLAEAGGLPPLKGDAAPPPI